MEWVDTTSYSRDDKERKPRWWAIQIGSLRVSVGNYHIYYPDGKTWLMNCRPWFDLHVLKATRLEDAQKEAIRLIRKEITKIMESLGKERG